MAQKKGRPITDIKGKKCSKSGAKLIKQYIGRTTAKLPNDFKKILLEEIKVLRLPRATPKYPFKLLHPPAKDAEYVQVGFGSHLFTVVDYAIIRFLFGTDDLNKVSKSRLKNLLVNTCNIQHSELEKCSWPDIREFLLSGIEVEYTTQLSRKAKSRQRKVKVKQQALIETDIKDLFKFNEAQALFEGKDLGLPSNTPVLTLKKLFDSSGEVVKHKDLDQNSTPSSASDALKGVIGDIRKAFRRHDIPCRITAKRGIGYVLQQLQTPSN